MNFSLETVCIRPKNFEQALHFYKDILGLKPTMECLIKGAHEERIMTFKAGAIEIELVEEKGKRYPIPETPKGDVPDLY